MMVEQKILNLIENVNPDDTDNMDDIDIRFWSYINKIAVKSAWREYDDLIVRYKNPSGTYPRHIERYIPEYSRSRDELKIVRMKELEGYFITVVQDVDLLMSVRLDKDDGVLIQSPFLITEELAEYHAIVQAMKHKIQHKEKTNE